MCKNPAGSLVWFPDDGGAEGNRTPDLHVANVALSQLSYGPGLNDGLGSSVAADIVSGRPFLSRLALLPALAPGRSDS